MARSSPVSTPDSTAVSTTIRSDDPTTACTTPEYNRFGVFAECPHCGGSMAPEHAHYRCQGCGWRDSCCD